MKKFDNEINELFDKSVKTISDSKICSDEIKCVVEKIISCLNNGKKIILFGNGGSAADAQHMAAEFIGRYLIERRSLPAIALTTDTSILTAVGNDYGFDKVFSRQCESLVEKDDIIIAISTSGNSRNIIEGIKTAKEKGAMVIGLIGGDGGDLKNVVDIPIVVPSKQTPRIQEAHRTIIHIICELVEKNFK